MLTCIRISSYVFFRTQEEHAKAISGHIEVDSPDRKESGTPSETIR